MDDPERDYHNFSTSSSHRLPTISGTQAIRDVVRNSRPVPTSLASLDTILGATNALQTTQRGLQKGVVTELYGPPGVGKTTFALQLAVNALHSLHEASKVTWIDTSSTLTGTRLLQMMDGYQGPTDYEPVSSLPSFNRDNNTVLDEEFNYIQVPSLHTLLALFMHPHPNFPPAKTGLVVIDDLSNLLLSSLPRTTATTATTSSQQTPSAIKIDHFTKQTSSRRFHIISNFGLALQKFAATHNVALLIMAKATVNLKAGQRATLRSALASQQWDSCLSGRLVLYRDSWPEQVTADDAADTEESHLSEDKRSAFRCVQVVRLRGKEVITREVGFVIEEAGIREVQVDQFHPDLTIQTIATQKLPDLADTLEDEDAEAEQRDEVFISQMDEIQDAAEIAIGGSTYDSDHGKRKAAEIAESDDDDHVESAPSRSKPGSPISNLSSISQIDRNAEQQDPKFQTAKKYRTQKNALEKVKLSQNSGQEHDHESEEMLLDLHEGQQ